MAELLGFTVMFAVLGYFFIAVFGGVECYAGDALIHNDCTIRATAVFGGVDIY